MTSRRALVNEQGIYDMFVIKLKIQINEYHSVQTYTLDDDVFHYDDKAKLALYVHSEINRINQLEGIGGQYVGIDLWHDEEQYLILPFWILSLID